MSPAISVLFFFFLLGGGGGGGWRFMEFWGEGGLKHNAMDGIVSIMFRPFADG